jgi:hypothetical protein
MYNIFFLSLKHVLKNYIAKLAMDIAYISIYTDTELVTQG